MKLCATVPTALTSAPNLIKLDDYLIEKYPNDPNRRVKSARIDSGDLARGSKRLRKALDAAGKPYIKLVASNGLDEKKIANMELYEHAHFDSYGVGENLITSASDPVYGGCRIPSRCGACGCSGR